MAKKMWHRVIAPRPWRAKSGEELVGTYLCSVTKTGQYGEYKVHYIKDVKVGVHYVSGIMSDDLFALVEPNSRVKLVFVGLRPSTEGKTYKSYELFTEEVIELRLAT